MSHPRLALRLVAVCPSDAREAIVIPHSCFAHMANGRGMYERMKEHAWLTGDCRICERLEKIVPPVEACNDSEERFGITHPSVAQITKGARE